MATFGVKIKPNSREEKAWLLQLAVLRNHPDVIRPPGLELREEVWAEMSCLLDVRSDASGAVLLSAGTGARSTVTAAKVLQAFIRNFRLTETMHFVWFAPDDGGGYTSGLVMVDKDRIAFFPLDLLRSKTTKELDALVVLVSKND